MREGKGKKKKYNDQERCLEGLGKLTEKKEEGRSKNWRNHHWKIKSIKFGRITSVSHK